MEECFLHVFSQCNYHDTSESLIDFNNFKENFLDSQQLTPAAWGCTQVRSFEKCGEMWGRYTNTCKRPLNSCVWDKMMVECGSFLQMNNAVNKANKGQILINVDLSRGSRQLLVHPHYLTSEELNATPACSTHTHTQSLHNMLVIPAALNNLSSVCFP